MESRVQAPPRPVPLLPPDVPHPFSRRRTAQGTGPKTRRHLHPALHRVRLKKQRFLEVEVLKILNYELVIKSSRLRTVEHRGGQIIKDIYEALTRSGGSELMPLDNRRLYDRLLEPSQRKRVLGDFIAGMTDRYAMALHAKLNSSTPFTAFTCPARWA